MEDNMELLVTGGNGFGIYAVYWLLERCCASLQKLFIPHAKHFLFQRNGMLNQFA